MEEYSKSNSPLMSEDVRAFMKAFIKARLKMEAATKEAKGNFGKYADINAIYEACIVPLGQEGIAVWHGADFQDGIEFLITRLIHSESGQWTQDKRVLYIERANSNQSRGSANTYARKLAVLSLCGLACEDDDCDVKPARTLNDEEVNAITQAIAKCANPIKIKNNILGFNKIQDLRQLTVAQIESVVSYIGKNCNLQ